MSHRDEYADNMARMLELIRGDGHMAPGGPGNVAKMPATDVLARVRIVCLSCLVVAGGIVEAADFGFDELLVDVGFLVQHQPLTADLYGDGNRQIIVAGRDANHVQYLAVYSLHALRNGDSSPLLMLNPGPELVGYDVGRIADRDALFFIEPGGIVRYDVANQRFEQVSDTGSIYRQPRSGDIVPIDFVRDLDDDGRDDLVVADTAGYRVRLQRANGSLGDESLLHESSRMTVSEGTVSFESLPLFSGDMNFDGLTDLGIWRGDTLHIYFRRDEQTFDGDGQQRTLGLGLLSERQMRALDEDAGSVDQRGLSLKNIVSIEDLNGDTLPDILIESTTSMGVFDKRSDLSLHLGRRVGDSLVYRNDEDALLASEGLQYGMVTSDIDGDGLQDLAVRNVRLTFGRVIRALLSGNVSLQLNFFRMTRDGRYIDKPSYEAKTSVRFSMGSGQIDVPAIEVADFDGDGIEDLVIETRTDELSLSRGNAGESLFARATFAIEVDLPRNGGLVNSGDVDGDGRSDLIMRYTSADGASAAQTVRVLIAR